MSWDCAACTFQNEYYAASCTVCTTVRPQQPPVPQGTIGKIVQGGEERTERTTHWRNGRILTGEEAGGADCRDHAKWAASALPQLCVAVGELDPSAHQPVEFGWGGSPLASHQGAGAGGGEGSFSRSQPVEFGWADATDATDAADAAEGKEGKESNEGSEGGAAGCSVVAAPATEITAGVNPFDADMDHAIFSLFAAATPGGPDAAVAVSLLNSILHRGGDVNFQRVQSDGTSALMAASRLGDAELVRHLLALGARGDGSVRDKFGLSTVDHARAAGHAAIVALLEGRTEGVGGGVGGTESMGRLTGGMGGVGGTGDAGSTAMEVEADVGGSPLASHPSGGDGGGKGRAHEKKGNGDAAGCLGEGPLPGLVANLVDMGFSNNAARRALTHTNNTFDAAIEWIILNAENDEINAPLPAHNPAREHSGPRPPPPPGKAPTRSKCGGAAGEGRDASFEEGRDVSFGEERDVVTGETPLSDHDSEGEGGDEGASAKATDYSDSEVLAAANTDGLFGDHSHTDYTILTGFGRRVLGRGLYERLSPGRGSLADSGKVDTSCNAMTAEINDAIRKRRDPWIDGDTAPPKSPFQIPHLRRHVFAHVSMSDLEGNLSVASTDCEDWVTLHGHHRREARRDMAEKRAQHRGAVQIQAAHRGRKARRDVEEKKKQQEGEDSDNDGNPHPPG